MNIITILISALLSGIISYFVAQKIAQNTVDGEKRKGRAMLMSAIDSFFINVVNSVDKNNNVKVDSLSKKQYVNELQSILSNLNLISSNPYFIKLIEDNEFVPKILVQVRREICEHENSDKFALNCGTIKEMIKLYKWCRKDIKKENNARKEIDHIVEELRKIKSA